MFITLRLLLLSSILKIFGKWERHEKGKSEKKNDLNFKREMPGIAYQKFDIKKNPHKTKTILENNQLVGIQRRIRQLLV